MKIFDKNGIVLLDIDVDDTSFRYRAIGQSKKVELRYSLKEHVELPIGSYIEFQGETYSLRKPENFTKKGERIFDYTVIMGGPEEVAKMYKLKMLSDIPYKLKFVMTAKPKMFVQLIVDNLNLYDSGWSVGSVIDAPEKLIAFNHEYCWTALGRISKEFETEFEIVNKTVNLRKVEYYKDSPLKLSYGKGNGFLPGLGRANQGDKSPVEILYVQGGEENIDFSTYGSHSLLLPKSQELVYNGHTYKTDSHGMYVTRADKELVSYSEDSFDAGHIFPKRVGDVSQVETVAGKDEDGNEVTFYNIIDSSIPADLDFEKCLIAGQTMTIIFQDGRLAGREFEAKYIHAERKFEIVSAEMDGYLLPNSSLHPSVGDKYAVFKISLPSAYICDNASKTGASWDMFREAVRYMSEHEEPEFSFKGKVDGIWSRKNWLNIGAKMIPGGYVDFSDTQFQPNGILIRIVGVRDMINQPHSPELELSNTPVNGFLTDDLGKLDADEVIENEKHKAALSFTMRRWRDAISMQSMLEKVFKDYGKGQTASWLRTMSVLVGHESLQYRFVDRIPTSSNQTVNEIDHAFSYDQNTKIFTAADGIIQHMTLGIEELAPSHKSTDYKFWNIAAYTSPYLDDRQAMYLYIKASKTSQDGEFLLSVEPHDLEEGSYYYFLCGALSEDIDGIRSFATLYGFSEIGPGWMRLNKIINTDGTQYWDMLNKAFRIGDDNSFIQFTQEGGLVLKGSIYQSPSGVIDYPEVDRGAYKKGTKYFRGDKVEWNGEIYKCVKDTDGTINPSVQNNWKKIVSRGKDGKPGKDGNPGQDGKDGQDGQDGQDGKDGNPGPHGPVAPFRGKYNSNAKYCGTTARTDIVQGRDGHFYIARTDNGESFNVAPPHTSWWIPFGAEFSSVATDLLLARRITAGEIATEDIVAEHIKTGYNGARIESVGSMMYVYGSNDVANIRFGVDKNGASTLQYWNDNNQFLYDLGPEGIRMIKGPSMFLRELSYIQAYTSGRPSWSKLLENTVKNPPTPKNYYEFDGGTIQHKDDGKHYDSNRIVGGNPQGNLIPDGWYVLKGAPFIQQGGSAAPTDGISDGMLEDYQTIASRKMKKFKGGKIVDEVNFYWNAEGGAISPFSVLAAPKTPLMANADTPVVYSASSDGKMIYQLSETTSVGNKWLICGDNNGSYKIAASRFKGERGQGVAYRFTGPNQRLVQFASINPDGTANWGETSPVDFHGTNGRDGRDGTDGRDGAQGPPGSFSASGLCNIPDTGAEFRGWSSSVGIKFSGGNGIYGTGYKGHLYLSLSSPSTGNTYVYNLESKTKSDDRLKNRFSNQLTVLDKLQEFSAFYYTYKSDEDKILRLGVSAQEVKKVFPQLVELTCPRDGETPYYQVDYVKLALVCAVNGCRELNELVKAQQKQIETLYDKLKLSEKTKGESQ